MPPGRNGGITAPCQFGKQLRGYGIDRGLLEAPNVRSRQLPQDRLFKTVHEARRIRKRIGDQRKSERARSDVKSKLVSNRGRSKLPCGIKVFDHHGLPNMSIEPSGR